MKIKSLTNLEKNFKGVNQYSSVKYPVEEMYKAYQSLHTIKAVAEKFNYHPKTVAKVFKEKGYKTKGRGFAAQKVFNNPFSTNDVDSRDYWIGFIAGDGYLHPTKYQISITTTDKEIVNNFKNFVGDGLSVVTSKRKTKDCYIASFSHKETYDYLISEGLTTKKSKTLKLKRMNWSIFRGLFDADGSFSQNRLKITSGSKDLIKQLCDAFNKIKVNHSYHYKSPKSTTFDFYIHGGRDVIKQIYKKFYDNSTYYLNRKRVQIRRYLQ